MLEVADIFRLNGAAYRAGFGDRLLPSQKRAPRNIEACRTAFLGGHLKKCGRCGRKVLEYLGRYVFRIAISNSRLERIQDGQVTFRYRDNHTQRLRRATLPAIEFIGRFLQHVLPPGCTKLRYYGLWSNSCRRQLEQARAQARQCLPPRFSSFPSGVIPAAQGRGQLCLLQA